MVTGKREVVKLLVLDTSCYRETLQQESFFAVSAGTPSGTPTVAGGGGLPTSSGISACYKLLCWDCATVHIEARADMRINHKNL